MAITSGSFWKPSRGPDLADADVWHPMRIARVSGDGGPIVVLAGGTGGAKLARGMLDVAGEDLVVIANTGDDVEIHGGHVSPDPDLVTFWLADRIDERGWGLRDDTFTVMDALRALGRGRLVQPRRPRPRGLPRARRGGSPAARR